MTGLRPCEEASEEASDGQSCRANRVTNVEHQAPQAQKEDSVGFQLEAFQAASRWPPSEPASKLKKKAKGERGGGKEKALVSVIHWFLVFFASIVSFFEAENLWN